MVYAVYGFVRMRLKNEHFDIAGNILSLLSIGYYEFWHINCFLTSNIYKKTRL